MRKKLIKISFENGKELMVEPETRVIDAIEKANIKSDEEILAVKINNKERSIMYHLIEDSKCDFITYSTIDGERIYSRKFKIHIFLWHYIDLILNYTLNFQIKTGRDYFAFVRDDEEVTTALVKEIKEEMKKIYFSEYKNNERKGK